MYMLLVLFIVADFVLVVIGFFCLFFACFFLFLSVLSLTARVIYAITSRSLSP